MKIFCISIHNENYSYFKNNSLTPVGLGLNYFDKNWINDKFKNDISLKNENFGEYSFHYKLWKDLLVKGDDNEWIGFCTYRRFWVKKNSVMPKNLQELSSIILKEIPNTNDLELIISENYKASERLPGLYLYFTNNINTVANAKEIQKVTVFKGTHTYIIKNTGINDFTHLLYWCKPFGVDVGNGETK